MSPPPYSPDQAHLACQECLWDPGGGHLDNHHREALHTRPLGVHHPPALPLEAWPTPTSSLSPTPARPAHPLHAPYPPPEARPAPRPEAPHPPALPHDPPARAQAPRLPAPLHHPPPNRPS